MSERLTEGRRVVRPSPLYGVAAEGMRRPDSHARLLRIARDSDLMRALGKPKSIQNSGASRGGQQFQQHRRSARRRVSTYRLGIR